MSEDKIKVLINEGRTLWSLNQGLDQACRDGDKAKVLSLIKQGANNWYDALYFANKFERKEIESLLVSKIEESKKKLEISITQHHNYLEDLLEKTKCVMSKIIEANDNTPQITLLKPDNEKAIYEDIMSQFKNLETDYVKSVTFEIVNNKYIIDILKDEHKVDVIEYTVFGYDGEYLKSFFLLDEWLKTKYTKSRDNLFFMLK